MKPGVEIQSGNARFISNTVALAVFAVAGTLLTLVQVKLLSTSLTREMFGLFASFRGLALLIATVSANGVPALLIRFLPVHEANRNNRAAVGLSLFSVACTLLLLVLAFLIVYAFKVRLFAFVPEPLMSSRLLFWFAVMSIGIALKLVIYAGLNGLRRLVHQVLIEIFSLAAVLLWVYLKRDALGIELLFKIFGIVSIGTLAASLPVWASFLRAAGSGPVSASGSYRQEYIGYWYGAAGLSIIAVAFTDFDRYLLSQIIALEFLALFHIGSRIMKLANRLLSVPNLAFQPEITRLFEEGKNERIDTSARVLIKFNSAFSFLLLALIIVFSREMVLVVATPEYLGALPLLIVLCFSLPLSTITAPVTTVMKALDQVRGALYCDLVWALVYLSLLFVLGMQFGIMGVGIAHVTACLAQLLLSLHISRLRVGYGFVLALAGKLSVCILAAFSPIIALVFFAGNAGATPVYYAGKIVLALVAVVLFHQALRRTVLFGEAERNMLREMFEKRGLKFLGRLFA
jgi:O-antigen/teichoic acid export membrane protein